MPRNIVSESLIKKKIEKLEKSLDWSRSPQSTATQTHRNRVNHILYVQQYDHELARSSTESK